MSRCKTVPFSLAVLAAASVVSLFGGASCSPNPAAPPAPPAEIPSALVLPTDITISVAEISHSASPPALAALVGSGPLSKDIEIGPGIIEETNGILTGVLAPFTTTEIPVNPAVTTFEIHFSVPDFSADFKLDFGDFDLNGDGVKEGCTGCTCPVGCEPDLAACPAEAPAGDLRPICARIWLDGSRFMAAVFNRVPTTENPESGSIRLAVPAAGDGAGTEFAATYDGRDPENKSIDMKSFMKDPDVGPDFFERRHVASTQEGPEASAKKTARLSSNLLIERTPGETSNLQYQAQFFSNLDFITFELIATGAFQSIDGVDNQTPPICAQISRANPVSSILCEDLGLSITTGDFVDPPELTDVQFPPDSEFPTTPTF
jgi:hypothetical protein